MGSPNIKSATSTAQMPSSYDNVNFSCTQKSYQILFPRFAGFPHNHQKRSITIVQNDLSFTSVFCSQITLLLVFQNLDIPTSQSALKQSYTEETNGQNNDDKVKKLILGSHSVSANYCNILYFRIMNNKLRSP